MYKRLDIFKGFLIMASLFAMPLARAAQEAPGGSTTDLSARKFGDADLQRICTGVRPHAGNKGKVRAFHLLDDKKVINAWADFEGKVTFTTGMMDFLKTEDEVAVICGHEVSHITAGHIKRSIGNMVLGTLIGGNIVGDILGSGIVNKQSRSHEREADERGLYAMWAAGYNPMAAVDVWERMAKDFGGDNLPFLSSHPGSDERTSNMKVLMVKRCLGDESLKYCDRILNDPDYKAAYTKLTKSK